MTDHLKKEILGQVAAALESVAYGKIIVELRGPGKPVDVVAEKRMRMRQREETREEPDQKDVFHT